MKHEKIDNLRPSLFWTKRQNPLSGILILVVLLAACAPVETPTPTEPQSQATQPASAVSPLEPTVIPTTTQPAQVTTPEVEGKPTLFVVGTPIKEETMPADLAPPRVPGDSYTSGLVDMAVKDLASRLKTPVDQIEFVNFEPVVWPDGGMGCPEPDKMYIQVQVEGYRIQLRYQGVIYNYHGGSDRPPFLCEQPQ